MHELCHTVRSPRLKQHSKYPLGCSHILRFYAVYFYLCLAQKNMQLEIRC